MKNIISLMKKHHAITALALLTLVVFFPHEARADPLGAFLAGIMGTISASINTVLTAAAATLGGILGAVGGVLAAAGLGPLWTTLMTWLFGAGACGQATMATGAGVGQMICNVVISSQMLPGLITGICYMIGLLCAVTALIKLKDHVLNPMQTPLSDSMKRFVAGGAFLALPIVTSAAQTLVYGNGAGALGTYAVTKMEVTGTAGYGLDTMLIALVADILQPMMNLFGAFGYLAGLIFIVIGIGRIIKTAQEGPRGPTGIGTIMTFVTAGVLFSLDGIMGAFSTSMFADSTIETYGVLDQTTGDANVDQHIENVIMAVTVFMFMIGWISFIRGFFILRDVSEGNGQASLMAAMTHIFGGALAVNLGPVMNAVQSTLGFSGFAVTFN